MAVTIWQHGLSHDVAVTVRWYVTDSIGVTFSGSIVPDRQIPVL